MALEKLRSIRDIDTTGQVEGVVGRWSNEWALGEAVRIGSLGENGKSGAGRNLCLPRRKGALGFCIVNEPLHAA